MADDLRATYEQWVDLLERVPGLVRSTDGLAIQLGVMALRDFIEARETVQREGLVVPDRSGGMRAHPALRQERVAYERVRKFITDFGLSPAERANIEIPVENEQSNRDRAMFGA